MGNLLEKESRLLAVYYRRYLKFDLIAAIVVFLVAIPLCLGIAMASGAPLFAGILSGIIGGIVVGLLSGSAVSVSGPAAGMAAAVLAAITALGDFNVFLLALTIAGVLQIITGFMRAGFIADYIPFSVVQGLLCAIGILLIVKQLPLAFTLSADLKELIDHLVETSEGVTLEPLVNLFYHLNNGAIIISLLSFAILLYFDKTGIIWLKNIPAPILVVLLGVVLNAVFAGFFESLTQRNPQLVNIPHNDGLHELIQKLNHPDFTAFARTDVWFYALILAALASIESLLNVKASEKLDPKHRYVSKDQELFAQGVGNVLSGLVGAIPVTSVIVRTSVNVQSGGKTRFSVILHGILLLLAVLLIPSWLNQIPLASLAAILIYTGYKLTALPLYISMYRQGIDRFIPFIVTIIGIVFVNMLAGVLLGLLCSLFYILLINSRMRIDLVRETHPDGVYYRLVLPQHTTFLNKAALAAELDSIKRHSRLIIDATNSSYIDKDILELIREFGDHRAEYQDIAINLVGFRDKYDIHDRIEVINDTTGHQ